MLGIMGETAPLIFFVYLRPAPLFLLPQQTTVAGAQTPQSWTRATDVAAVTVHLVDDVIIRVFRVVFRISFATEQR